MNGMETQERTVPQIELRGLSKVYQIPGGEVQALNNINLAIEQGDIYGIIGMSGAGKCTLIRCLNRLETPTDGRGADRRPERSGHEQDSQLLPDPPHAWP